MKSRWRPGLHRGVLMGKRKNGRYIVADVINKQMSASDVRKTIKLTAQADRAAYKRVRIPATKRAPTGRQGAGGVLHQVLVWL